MADSTVLTQDAPSGSEKPGKVESSGSETLPRSDTTLYETLPAPEPTTPWWTTSVGRALLLLLVLLAFGYTLRFSQALMLPIVLALLLAIILAPMVRLLRKLFLPNVIAAAIVVAAFAGGAGFAIYSLADPAANWLERAPQTMRDLERKVRKLMAPMIEARQAAEKVEQMTNVDGDKRPREVTLKEQSLAKRMMSGTQAAAVYVIEVIILAYFFLAFGEIFLRRLVKIPPSLRAKIQVVKMTQEIESEISNYLFTIACINAGLGVATAIALYFLKMPNPVLWGVMAAVFNFVPYLGSGVTLVVLTAVALLTFPAVSQALLVPAAFLALATIEGQFVNPIILGRRMALSPMVIVIALMIGAWVWGVVGLLIAVPVLVTFKIYCSHSEHLAPIGDLLGRD